MRIVEKMLYVYASFFFQLDEDLEKPLYVLHF